MKEFLSVIVITRNEEHDIRDCLESVKAIASEIIIADSGSTDRTLDICKEFTDKIFFCEWKGYGPQKEFALAKAQGPWVLNIDADERLSPELLAEISQVLNENDGRAVEHPVNGYSMPFVNYFFGRELRFASGWNERHIRLFRKYKATYGTAPIHEGIRVEPPIHSLQGRIIHTSYQNLSEYLSKCNRYTSLIAEEKFKVGKKFHWFHHLRLPYEFVVRYFFQLGFLDGTAGLVYTLLSSYYVWLKFLKLRELERNAIATSRTAEKSRR